ncbi:hypothetical protein [Sulfurihydrogenibium sp.]|jgi:hypothetical protein|uniref:hypothetical protein n=1 Tax=Sulfurihydrogenibium sp. TaxID=2053621 RepID=UPI002635E935|nr:hypothetical protein [Sulfurihydrogenibium sp.]
MAKWLNDLYNEYMEEELEENIYNSAISNKQPVIGGVYFGSLRSLDKNKPNKPLYFLVVDKVDDNIYEVLKVSDYHLFATNSDVILELGPMTIMVETTNNFYLTAEEISRFILLDALSREELDKIIKFRDGYESELKKGFTPIFEDDIRNKFKQEEFNQIKEFHARIFEILAEPEEMMIEIAPERISEFVLRHVASTPQKATYTDDFVLYRGDDFIEIILDEKYLNKKVKIFLDNDTVFNGILKDTSIFIPVKEQIDLEEFAKHISIIAEG